jgi:type IV secretory pathway protease TraF
MPTFQHHGPVPPGRYFVLGEHPGSFDSRYFGMVPASSISAALIPL